MYRTPELSSSSFTALAWCDFILSIMRTELPFRWGSKSVSRYRLNLSTVQAHIRLLSKKGCRLHTDVLGQLFDGVGTGNSRDIAELLKGHGSFLSACFFYPTAEPPKTQRIFFFEIPNEHCRHIQDTFYPPCNFPYNSTAVLKRLQHSHITKEAFRYGTTAK